MLAVCTREDKSSFGEFGLNPLEKGLERIVPVKLEGVEGSIIGVCVPSSLSLMFPIEALWDCAEKSLVREAGDFSDID